MPAVVLAAMLCAEASLASAQDGRGTFRVDIRLEATRPASCALHGLAAWHGAVARVTCLTADTPSFGTAGWTLFDAEGRPVTMPATRSARVGGADRRGVDRRAMHSATIEAPAGANSQLEVEVSF
jgi:hypothetical protein